MRASEAAKPPKIKGFRRKQQDETLPASFTFGPQYAIVTSVAFTPMNLAELTFYRHPVSGFQALAEFDNGYGLSIIPESDGATYEVAVLFNGTITYESGLTEDVFRYLTVDSIDDIAAVARSLQPPGSVYFQGPTLTATP